MKKPLNKAARGEVQGARTASTRTCAVHRRKSGWSCTLENQTVPKQLRMLPMSQRTEFRLESLPRGRYPSAPMKKTIRIWALAVPLAMACHSSLVLAEDEKTGFAGEAELGVVSTSGNTDSRSLNGKAKLRYLYEQWRHEGRLEALHTSDDGATSAERYLASGKSDYLISETDYLFATVRYEKDRFSGYDYQFSEALGYGRRLINEENLKLDLEAGPGARHSRLTGEKQHDEAMFRLAGKLAWDISETARFTQEALLETAKKNTYTESVTAISVRINASFALRLAFTAKHNSKVPAGTKKTDTLTAVSLVYDF